jgi:hypothetical protein
MSASKAIAAFCLGIGAMLCLVDALRFVLSDRGPTAQPIHREVDPLGSSTAKPMIAGYEMVPIDAGPSASDAGPRSMLQPIEMRCTSTRKNGCR